MNVERILLIDDEPDIRAVAELSLEQVGGFSLDSAASGEEGLERARAQRPDLVLLDMMMPGLDGLETLALFRADPEIAGIPVIFMTARSQPAELEEYLAAGALGVILKPFDPMELPNEIRKLTAPL